MGPPSVQRAIGLRNVLAARASDDLDARLTSDELDESERAIASIVAGSLRATGSTAEIHEALLAAMNQGAAPRSELPLCRDVVLSLTTVLGFAELAEAGRGSD